MAERYLDTWSDKRGAGKLSLIDRAKLALMKLPADQGLISGMDQNTAARMIDISHWNGDCDIKLMRDQGDIAMVSMKASDGKQVRAGDSTQPKWYVDDWLYRNVQKCYDAHVAAAPYHYVQPAFDNYTAKGAADWNWTVIKHAMQGLVPKKSFHAFVFDFEEKTASNYQGTTVMVDLINRALNDPQLSQVPIILYTSMGVLNYYSNLIAHVGRADYPVHLWMAQWVYTKAGNLTWQQLISNVIPTIEMKVMTPGFNTWKFLQWTASPILPGCNGGLDLNFFAGKKANLGAFLGFDFSQTTPQEPPTDPQEPAPDFCTREEYEALYEAHTALQAQFTALEQKFAAHVDPANKQAHPHKHETGDAL